MVNLDPHWRARLSQYNHLYLGYSGGLDSTVLLALVAACSELCSKLTAIHVHHGLSPNADAWADHCEAYSQQLSIPCETVRIALAQGANLEERARIARYAVFTERLERGDALLLAHQQNDQTETLLLNLLRGTGLDGLCAMPEQRDCGKGVLLRPLLHDSRERVHAYAKQHALHWIDDEMNAVCDWSRSYLRHKILPLLQEKWPNAIATIATSAQHCQQAKKNLDVWLAQACSDLNKPELELTNQLLNDRERCTQVVRVWLKYHLQSAPSTASMQQILNAVIFARPDAMPCMRWGEWTLRRYQHTLYLFKENVSMPSHQIWLNFPQPIAWSDQLVTAVLDPMHGIAIPRHSRIELKNRQGGETFHWHGQTQSLKKLFQYWRIPPWRRAQIPLIYVNDCLMAIPGYAQSDLLLCAEPSERYTIQIHQQSRSCESYDSTSYPNYA